ncbi:acyl-CoA dehydrogenase [Nitrosomonas mobilis]|uniref:Acyl-coenzyme A dehydrogenase n=1 Tax=Nitrosomonas mobilis TaxID=51642 RepID=A0A1G5SCJ5_9PROT|nr:acyl-CoA dehydrogenase [Nitrosomonas mobilis]SCZ84838.1 acyl coenzyme A dehydrogenase [Nitrosomonas mobilis]
MFEFILFILLLLAVVVALFMTPFLRRNIISNLTIRLFRKLLPQISQTEQEALDAGTVWWEGELFSGRPDWNKLTAYPKPVLTQEEKIFIDGPVEELCAMLDEWHITHERHDLPPNVWQFIKEKGFFSLIIPKEYGGYGFSALAHSEVVMKIGSRSNTAAVTVMVPNSLGPAELLLHYGTDAQKDYYLPRLAKGLEVPCFALTGPDAGSDAGSIPDVGVVCRETFDGKPDVLGLRVTWEKRYITLGPIATLLGLAFRARDPQGLLGGQEDLGITLALIPTSTPGVNIGRRHFPLNGAFQNGPNSGQDVFIPMDWVIGGQEKIGQGWRMLMNSLSVGRSISLPATSVGAAKLAAWTSGAYGRIRTQFNLPIGYFEGVEEALARIAGNTYMMDAARIMTAGAVDLGEEPSVISAIVKYHLTERSRQAINDAMDIHGGKGICLGPTNYLGRTYQQIPVGITVEGANILTRNMIIFGQGAIRAHPFVLKEIDAAWDQDKKRGLQAFDQALVGHLAFTARNVWRSFFWGIAWRFSKETPAQVTIDTANYYRLLARFSAAFALLADIAMIKLGGSLKRRERLSARLGDILSMLYLCSAALKRYEDDGRPAVDLPLLHWSLQDALYRMQQAFDEFLLNFPTNVLMRGWLRLIVFPLGKPFDPPSDELSHQIARLLLTPGEGREHLTTGIYLPTADHEPLAQLEQAFVCSIACEPIEAKLRKAVKDGMLNAPDSERISSALKKNILSAEEASLLEKMKVLRRRVIMVDDFSPDFMTDNRSAAASEEVIP